MKPLILTLRGRPEQRLDMAPLTAHRLAGMTAKEIEKIELHTTRRRVVVGEAFRLRMGDATNMCIEESCDRLDQIGQGMAGGEILVDGNLGARAGRLMSDGRLTIRGNAGPWTASGMTGGAIEITGDADGYLGAPGNGEIAGMRGGVVVVRGNAGDRVGDRMRRGIIIVEGNAGAYAGSRMIAGTLVIAGRAGPLPGYLMRRGTIVLGEGTDKVSPTFIDCGAHDLVALQLMASYIANYSSLAAGLFKSPLRRFAGDTAVFGKGEIFSRR